MADDFEGAAGNLPGGAGPSGAVVGLSRRYRTQEEKLQDMRRHLREQEERFKKAERMKKAREKEMASKWVEYEQAKRVMREQELRDRLAHLARQKQHTERKAAEKKSHQAEAGAAARTTIPTASAGSAGGGGLPDVRKEADAPMAPDISGGAAGTATPGSRSGERSSRRERSPGHGRSKDCSDPEDTGSPSSRGKKSPRMSPRVGRAGGPGGSQRARKKKREEVITPRGITVPVREKSIMQEAQEMFPGLNKSPDGREILASGNRNQKKTRDALVRGDPVALEEVEKEAKEKNTEEEQEAEVQEQPSISNRHMARRYRLRMMHQITSQVLQCRKKMAINFQQSLLSPRGLGCSPYEEADEPRSPMNCPWIG